jgi:DNA-binding NarL/FixJ family response regulator
MNLNLEIAVVLDGKRTTVGTLRLDFPFMLPQRKHLSKREQQVLDLVVTGKSNKEIATEVGVTERTVKFHVSKLLSRFGAKSRIELAAKTKY